MKTVVDIIALSWNYVQSKTKHVSKRDVELLLAHILKIKRLDLYLNFDRPLQENELFKMREGLKRLIMNEPIEYIEESVQFFGCSIQVNKNVLIPRPETELLVERIVSYLKKKDLEGKTFVDLCSGSGCIGIAVKKACPELDVTLIDISHEALVVSRENARINGVTVHQLQGDLFAPLQGVDYLASNPPYVSIAEYEALDPSVKNFEPKLALVGGPTGLEFYRRIAEAAPQFVKERLWLEIGASQGPVVKKIFENLGHDSVVLEKDLAGHDRFLSVTITIPAGLMTPGSVAPFGARSPGASPCHPI